VALSPVVPGALAAAVTVLVTPLVIRVALRMGVVDHPGPLKPHERPIPYLGGIAVFCGVTAATVGSARPAVLVPLALALVLGLLDDVTSLPALPRLVVELGIGVAVAWVTAPHGAVEGAGVALATVVLINAVNMVDGIDGLALGTCAVTAVGFALLAPSGWQGLATAFAGAALGLLLFNRPPAKVYLGDAGSYLLGTAVAVLAGAQWSATDSAPDLAVLACLVGYLWVEFASTVGRRLLSRRSLFGGDREHVYDRLERSGIPKARVTGMLVAGQAIVVGLAVAGDLLDPTALPLVVVVLAAAVVLAALPSTSRSP
jgi:UDP-N-acetylmuramyl pentapeptide phosphotransferase/UDP-N-acetylglucosamine-1-phosphate transferase